MSKKLTAIAVSAATAATLAAVAMAGPGSTKQQIGIQLKGGAGNTTTTFVLAPLTPGSIQRDSGAVDFCCWSTRQIVRNGLALTINDPQMTLTGKRGTLIARNQIEWVDLPDGWSSFTGTWKVIRGTGAYAGLVGGGREAAVSQPNGYERAQFAGFLSSK